MTMSIRVLIADTDRHLLAGYKQQLSSRGLRVAVADSGLDCLERLREFKPHALVLEPGILWGGGDGVLALLHEQRDLPQVLATLVLTSGCSPQLLYRVAHFAVDDYLAKPVSGEAMARRILAALARVTEGTSEASILEGTTTG
jgi:DNA-binding response OmpR family regulator